MKNYNFKEKKLYWCGDILEGDIYCPKCGTLGPSNLPKFYLRHCNYCGSRLYFKTDKR